MTAPLLAVGQPIREFAWYAVPPVSFVVLPLHADSGTNSAKQQRGLVPVSIGYGYRGTRIGDLGEREKELIEKRKKRSCR
jgi:hypothetical protein